MKKLIGIILILLSSLMLFAIVLSFLVSGMPDADVLIGLLLIAALSVGIIIFGRRLKSGGKAPARKREKQPEEEVRPVEPEDSLAADAKNVIESSEKELSNQAAEKDASAMASGQELVGYFEEYFAPNRDFYSVPGSEKFQAYFNALNAARDEMLRNPDLFKAATKWDPEMLVEMLENPKRELTNMLVCGLIFRTGEYAVTKSALLCVDFCERIPYCIAVYLLLTAQKLPKEKRKQVIDAGDGADKTAFIEAMKSLEVLDPDWSFSVF